MKRNLLLVLYFVIPVFLLAQTSPPKRELRAAWIATFSNIDWPSRTQTPLQQRNAFVTLMNHHAQTGLNAVFVQMRSQCDALYPSSIEPWSADLNGVQGRAPNPLWDPMQFAIEECRKRGIEFHAWLNPYRAVSLASNLPNFSPSHVARTHPEWTLTVGTTIILNPGLPQVRAYINSVVTDILTRYDVDGIHFDDYFYPSGTILDDAAFLADPRGFTNRADWRRDNVNLLIQQIYQTVKTLKPWVKFGVSPSGIYRNSTNPDIGTPTSGLEHYTTLYADSKKWLQQGWVDYLAPQVYWYIGQPGANYAAIVPWWNNQANGRHIYIGMAGYKVNDPAQGPNWANPSQIPNEVRLNRSYPNIFGQSIYNTSSLRSSTRLGFRDSLRLFFYNVPALRPAMPWRDNTPPAPASALTAQKFADDSVVLNWTLPPATTNELDKARQFVIYRSTNPSFSLADAVNILAITPKDSFAFADTTIEPQTRYYYAVTALDRFHNESAPSNRVADLPPAITCPVTQTLVLNAGCSATLPDYRSLATVSNAVLISQSPAPGTVLQGTGQATVTLTATNPVGQSATCTFVVQRTDQMPPQITDAGASPGVLNVPNNKMHRVSIAYSATDNCGSVTTRLSIRSNEPNSGSDWEVINNHEVMLRAARLGRGQGRTYTITIHATDGSGNTASRDVYVVIPHDQRPVTRAVREKSFGADDLVVTVLPNPTPDRFTITTLSKKEESLSLRITDNAGRVVERLEGLMANGTIHLGHRFRPGIYYLQLTQGGITKTVKLVKLGH